MPTIEWTKINESTKINNNSQSQIPFKTLSSGEFHMNNVTFNYLFTRVFAHLKDSNSKYYLGDNQWLALTFKSIFTKKSELLSPIHEYINDFYKIYPFDIENIFTEVVSDFLKEYTFKETVTVNNYNLKIFKEKGLEELVIKKIVPNFLKHVETNMVPSKLTTRHKSFKELFQTSLRNKIEKIVKLEDEVFKWSNYSNLDKWIKEFDYKSAKLLNIQNIYDDYFSNKKNLQEINLQEEIFLKNLNDFFNQNLNIKNLDININYKEHHKRYRLEWTLMWQAFLHYLFFDLIKNKKIKPVEIWSLDKASDVIKKLKNDKQSFIQTTNYLNVILEIFPDLRKMKYNFFSWISYNLIDDALLMFYPKKAQNYSLGIQLNIIDFPKIVNVSNEYLIKIELKFVTPAVPSSNKTNKIFPIKFVKTEEDFTKAKKMVENFFKANPVTLKKDYSFDSELITEKDFVERISSWKNINDFNNMWDNFYYHFNFYTGHKFIASNDLNNFISINLSEINKQLASLNNSYYNFKLQAKLKISKFESTRIDRTNKRNNHSYYYVIYLFLIQEAKDKIFSLWKEYKISLQNSFDFNIGFKKKQYHYDSSWYYKPKKALFIIGIIKDKLEKEFFQKIDFKPWDDQKRSFWLEEFQNQKDNIITTNDAQAQEILDQRSNVPVIKKYLEPLIAKIAKYRKKNDITFEYKSEIEKNLQTKEWIIKLDFIIKDKTTSQTLTFQTQRKLMSLEKYQNNPIFDFLRFSKPASPFNDGQQKEGSKIPKNFVFLYYKQKQKKTILFVMTISDMIKKLESHGFKNVKYSSVLYDKSKNNLPYINFSFDVPYYHFASGEERLKNIVIKVYLKDHNFIVTPTEIESRYKDILSRLSPLQRKNKNFMDNINKLFSKWKDPITNKWKDDITRDDFINNISEIEDLISKYQEKDVLEIISRLSKIYGNDIPQEILDKALDPSYYKILKEILNQRQHIGDKNIRKILENNKFINFLKKQKINKVRSFILDFLKITEKTKYAYFGMGIGFGLAGLLSIGATGWQMKANAKSRKINVKFRRNKYLSIMTLSSALITIAASTVFMFLFFITKGGF